jgi:hypothetical protein
VSAESQEILYAALHAYKPGDDPAPLRAAAVGHLGASRSLEELMAEYAATMEGRENHSPEQHAAAQRVADEMAPVNLARRITAGLLPGMGSVAGDGG